jgi:hypothetical protein
VQCHNRCFQDVIKGHGIGVVLLIERQNVHQDLLPLLCDVVSMPQFFEPLPNLFEFVGFAFDASSCDLLVHFQDGLCQLLVLLDPPHNC